MQNHSHNVLDTGKVGRLLLILTAPMFFGALVQSIYSLVDTIFVGRYVGSLGIAGLSIVMSIQFLVQGTASIISVGGASLISRLIGGSDHRRAERALGNGITFSIIFSALLMLLIIPGADFWLKLIGASEDVLPFARDYLVITMLGTFFNVGSLVLIALIRAEGNTRVGMVSVILQSVLNIILDAVFMIPLGMGVKGAALATVISQLLGLLYAMNYYLSGNSNLKIHWRNLIPDLGVVKSIFAIGIGQFFSSVANAVSMMLFVKMTVNYGGDMALSAFGIAQRIMMFAMMPCMNLGVAMQPILGFNYGAKHYNLVLKTLTITIIVATAFNIAAWVPLFFFPELLAKIFTSDTQLIAEVASASRYMFPVLPLFVFQAAGQVFPSIGKAVETFIIAISRPLIFMTPLVLILPHYFGLHGVWLSFPGSDILSFLFTGILLIPLIRKFRKAAVEEQKTGTALSPHPAESTEGKRFTE